MKIIIFRSTTLNDIYRNLGLNQKINEDRKLRRQDQFIDDAAEYKDEYEEGDVTGFMVEKPLPQQNSGINSFDVRFLILLTVVSNVLKRNEK